MVKDGKDAGQSVPHVHAHIIPRKSTDYEGDNDKIYPALETAEKQLRGDMVIDSTQTDTAWNVPLDKDRQPRSLEEMEKEAIWLRSLFESA